ncbi:MAG: hypothetical protein M0030_07665 [Actinomycetota bacterium]|nr:hypothetical protein [Actinomycetota bacterium]
MATAPKSMDALRKQILDFRVTGSNDLRELTELTRALVVDVLDVVDIAESEIRAALGAYDKGRYSNRRARAVARPMRQAGALLESAARRCIAVWRTYLRQYAQDIRPSRADGVRRFNPEK